MIEIGMHKIYKNFGYKQVLNDVNFEIVTSQKVGIVGKNGSGKSTLFKIITKEEYPDSGTVTIRKQATIGYLQQIPTIINNDLTTFDILMEAFIEIQKIEHQLRTLETKMVIESNDELLDKYSKVQNQYVSLGGYEIEEKLNKVITGFKLDNILDTPFTLLSGGQKTIINLAKLILSEPDILLLDEPTNHLDISMLEWLENYLNKYQGTVVIISHDRHFLDKVTTKTILLENGKSQLFHGNYSYSLKEQERLLLLEFEHYKNQQKKIDAIKAAIKRYRDWGNQGDNEQFFRKAKELEKRLDKMTVIDKPQLEKKKLPINFLGNRSSKEVVKAIDLTMAYDDLTLFSKATFTIYYQERIVLLGNNGSGKSSLIKAILDDNTNYNGKLKIADNVLIGYIPQEIHFSNDKQTILKEFCQECNCLEGIARGILAKYDFYQDQIFKRVGSLSGGEKVLLKLAILMQKEINFLILDEPTNHIDIETREILEQSLLEYNGTLLFVSHDRYFIDKLANRKLEISNQMIHSTYL